MTARLRRVVITGMGLISPLGNSKQALWEALCAGRSGVAPLSSLSQTALPIRFAAEAPFENDDIGSFGPLDKERKKAIRKGLKVMCRECQMGVAAAQLALDDSGMTSAGLDPERVGISFGADYMLSDPEEMTEAVRHSLDERGRFQFSRWGGTGLPKMSPLWLLKYLPNMPASHLAIYDDLRGPNNSITLREAAANAALGEAYQIILRGSADAMLAGATGTRIHVMKMLHTLQQEELADAQGDPTKASRPFDRNRTGMVLGEGAGAVILEELATAQARGATIYGEIVAAACSSAAAGRLVARRDRAMLNVVRRVLEMSGMGPSELGHLHAHGLSTRSGDAEESQVICEVFGDRAKPLPIVAAKSHFGNLGAGGGMVELIASLMALGHGSLFRVLNYETPDPECPVAAVCQPETPAGDSFINLNVTPQGQAAAVLVRRFE
jgi:3-oxoacyl-[acyl-carrier-protein] synthase II